jgi:hypothetical protein
MTKTFLILQVILLHSECLIAQKQRVVTDTSKYLCQNDSIADVLLNNLKVRGVDSIISVLYDYDNGRIENTTRIIIWSDNGYDSLRLIQGCDGKIRDSVLCENLFYLWEKVKNFYSIDLNERVSNSGYQSHDLGYSVDLFLPVCRDWFSIRNYQRRNHLEKVNSPDARVVFINSLELATMNFVRKSTAKEF